jgi:hypothetical protein
MIGRPRSGARRALAAFAGALLMVVGLATPAAGRARGAGSIRTPPSPPAPGEQISSSSADTTNALRQTALPAIGPWQQVNRYSRLTLTSGQGLATIVSGPSATILYRGNASIPPRLYLQGWQHIGDPGGHGGYLFDAYQGPANATAKMYEVTTATGNHVDFIHPLVPGEAFNNSFAAVSPNGQWMVSGEWGTMHRLLILPTPLLNPAAATPGRLEMAGTIELSRRVRNVQGCDFVTVTRLLCSSDDPGTDLFPTPRQLLEVDLPGALTGVSTTATVSALGALPMQSVCPGTFETEGIDHAPDGDLRVEVIPPEPCSLFTTVYVYRHA